MKNYLELEDLDLPGLAEVDNQLYLRLMLAGWKSKGYLTPELDSRLLSPKHAGVGCVAAASQPTHPASARKRSKRTCISIDT